MVEGKELNMKRVLTAIALGLVAVVGLSACATAEPDKMGLYYMQGSITIVTGTDNVLVGR